MSDEQPRPPYVWWSPTAGIVLRHPENDEQYVAVSGRYGAYLREWPTDGVLLRAEHADWQARAQTWERLAAKFGADADARVAHAEAAEAQAVANHQREKAARAKLKAERVAIDYGALVSGSEACAEAAAKLRAAAAGRREYLPGIDPATKDALEAQAATLEQAAAVVEGDLGPLYSWLPSWRWTDEMDADLKRRSDQ